MAETVDPSLSRASSTSDRNRRIGRVLFVLSIIIAVIGIIITSEFLYERGHKEKHWYRAHADLLQLEPKHSAAVRGFHSRVAWFASGCFVCVTIPISVRKSRRMSG